MDPDDGFRMFKTYHPGEIEVGREIQIKEADGTITTDVILGFYRTTALTVTGRRIC